MWRRKYTNQCTTLKSFLSENSTRIAIKIKVAMINFKYNLKRFVCINETNSAGKLNKW